MDGLVQERRNSIAKALELRLSCTNPSIYTPIDFLKMEIDWKIITAASIIFLSCVFYPVVPGHGVGTFTPLLSMYSHRVDGIVCSMGWGL